MVKVLHKDKDITEIITSVNWSGDYKQAARKVSFNVAVAPHDPYLPVVSIMMGDMVKILYNNAEIFRGYVFFKEKSVEGSEMQVTAYDGLIYLLKSKATYNFKDMTPGKITRRLCDDFNIKMGDVIEGSKITRLFEGTEIYNILMTAYTLEYENTGIPYMPRMVEGNLEVVRKGVHKATYVLDAGTSILDANYSESMEESVNQVKVYDKEGNSIGTLGLSSDSGVVGVLQDVFKEDDKANALGRARSLLKGIQRTAEVDAVGDIECITGNAVVIRESFTGINGLFWIDSDEHTFSEGQHTMKLKLAYENIMDEQEAGSVENEGDKENAGTTIEHRFGTVPVLISSVKVSYIPKAHMDTLDVLINANSYLSKWRPLLFAILDYQIKIGAGTGVVDQGQETVRAMNGYWISNHIGFDVIKSMFALPLIQGISNPKDDMRLKLLLQTFNLGEGYYKYATSKGGHTVERAQEYIVMLEKEKEISGSAKKILETADVRFAEKILEKYKVEEEQVVVEPAQPEAPQVESGGSDAPVNTGSGSKRQRFINAAISFKNFKYSQDHRMSSWAVDCSSLVGRAMVKAGLTNKAFMTTRTIPGDSRFYQVPISQIKPGDIVWRAGHVAVVIAPGRLIEAANPRQHVIYSGMRREFTRGYRIRGIDS